MAIQIPLFLINKTGPEWDKFVKDAQKAGVALKDVEKAADGVQKTLQGRQSQQLSQQISSLADQFGKAEQGGSKLVSVVRYLNAMNITPRGFEMYAYRMSTLVSSVLSGGPRVVGAFSAIGIAAYSAYSAVKSLQSAFADMAKEGDPATRAVADNLTRAAAVSSSANRLFAQTEVGKAASGLGTALWNAPSTVSHAISESWYGSEALHNENTRHGKAVAAEDWRQASRDRSVTEDVGAYRRQIAGNTGNSLNSLTAEKAARMAELRDARESLAIAKARGETTREIEEHEDAVAKAAQKLQVIEARVSHEKDAQLATYKELEHSALRVAEADRARARNRANDDPVRKAAEETSRLQSAGLLTDDERESRNANKAKLLADRTKDLERQQRQAAKELMNAERSGNLSDHERSALMQRHAGITAELQSSKHDQQDFSEQVEKEKLDRVASLRGEDRRRAIDMLRATSHDTEESLSRGTQFRVEQIRIAENEEMGSIHRREQAEMSMANTLFTDGTALANRRRDIEVKAIDETAKKQKERAKEVFDEEKKLLNEKSRLEEELHNKLMSEARDENERHELEHNREKQRMAERAAMSQLRLKHDQEMAQLESQTQQKKQNANAQAEQSEDERLAQEIQKRVNPAAMLAGIGKGSRKERLARKKIELERAKAMGGGARDIAMNIRRGRGDAKVFRADARRAAADARREMLKKQELDERLMKNRVAQGKASPRALADLRKQQSQERQGLASQVKGGAFDRQARQDFAGRQQNTDAAMQQQLMKTAAQQAGANTKVGQALLANANTLAEQANTSVQLNQKAERAERIANQALETLKQGMGLGGGRGRGQRQPN